jgi:hypothetical protein
MFISLAALVSLAVPILAISVWLGPIGRCFNHMLALEQVGFDVDREQTPDTKIPISAYIMAYIRAARNTGRLMLREGRDLVLQRVFGPSRKLGQNLLVINYYHGHSWHQALVKHTGSISPVLKVEAGRLDTLFPAGEPKLINITDEIKPLLGPDGRCWGQRLTPHDLGYTFLVFDLFRLDGILEPIRVDEHQDIATILEAY